MKILLILVTLVQMSLGKQALNIEYDKVFVARLKFPVKASGKKFFKEAKDFKDQIESAVLVKPQFHKRINKLFGKESKFDNGLGDINLQLYALLFYKKQKLVLVICPNILGANLNATDQILEYDPRSLSSVQIQEFLRICYLSLGISSVEELVKLPLVKKKAKVSVL